MTREEDIIVTMKHVREAQMCSSGTRKFFQRHQLDFNLFLTSGLPASVILATNDAMAHKVVEIARGRK